MAVTTPFWTVKTRMCLFQEYNQAMTSRQIAAVVIKDMWKEGPKTFYRGFTPSLFMSFYGVIQMCSYEGLTHALGYESGKAKRLSWDNLLVPFFVGGTSRSLASVTLMPINVVRMRMQMKNYTKEEVDAKHLGRETNKRKEIVYQGARDTARKIWQHEGAAGFFKGLTPSVLKIFPTSGIFFLAYEISLGLL